MKLPRTKLYISFFDLLNAYIKILFGIDSQEGKYVKKFENLKDLNYLDCVDKNEFIKDINNNSTKYSHRIMFYINHNRDLKFILAFKL